MVWGALLLAATIQSPLDTPITFDGPTSHLPALMKQIGDQAEVRITVQGAPELDWVYARFRSRPLKSVLDEVARITRSSWSQTAPDQFKIHAPWPPAVDPKARTAKIQQWLQANPVPPAITPSMADKVVADALESSAKPNRCYYDPEGTALLAGRTPNDRIFRRLVQWIGAARLGELQPGESLEWREQGRGQILAGGPAFAAFARDLQVDSSVYAEALGRKGISEATWKKEYGQVPAIYAYVLFDTVVNGRLRVVATAHDTAIRLQISVIDSEGTYHTLEGPTQILLAQETLSTETPFDAIEAPFETPEEWKRLQMTPEDLKRVIETSDAPRLTESAREHILACGERETLTAYSDLLLRPRADHTGNDIIAIVPDYFLSSVIYGLARTSFLRDPLKRLFRNARYEVNNGVLIVSDGNLAVSRISRIARPQAAAVYREMADLGYVKLGALAEMAAAQGSEDALIYAVGYLELLGHQRIFPFIEVDLLMIYGHMTPAQRKAAASPEGAIIPIGGSDPLTLAATKAAFASTAHVRSNAPESWDERIAEDRAPNSSADDPKWVFANGLPPGSFLNVRILDREKLYGRYSYNGAPGTPNQVSEWQIVMDARTAENANPIYASVPTTEMQVSIVGPGLGFVQRRGTIPHLTSAIKFVDAQSLAKPIRDRIDAVREKMRSRGN